MQSCRCPGHGNGSS